jgi:hypothetical protein
VDFIVRPEPDPEERKALMVAVERLLAGADVPPAYKSRWRSDGIAENLGGDEEGQARAPA